MYVDYECNGESHVDTSCLFFLRPAFRIMPYWATMPRQFGPICDRAMWQIILAHKLSSAHHASRPWRFAHSMSFTISELAKRRRRVRKATPNPRAALGLVGLAGVRRAGPMEGLFLGRRTSLAQALFLLGGLFDALGQGVGRGMAAAMGDADQHLGDAQLLDHIAGAPRRATTGRPPGSLRTSTSRQLMPLCQPVPRALRIASLAAQRPAKC